MATYTNELPVNFQDTKCAHLYPLVYTNFTSLNHYWLQIHHMVAFQFSLSIPQVFHLRVQVIIQYMWASTYLAIRILSWCLQIHSMFWLVKTPWYKTLASIVSASSMTNNQTYSSHCTTEMLWHARSILHFHIRCRDCLKTASHFLCPSSYPPSLYSMPPLLSALHIYFCFKYNHPAIPCVVEYSIDHPHTPCGPHQCDK